MFGTFKALGSSSSNCHTKTQPRHEQNARTHTSSNRSKRKAVHHHCPNQGTPADSVKNGDKNTELVLTAGPAGSNQLWLGTGQPGDHEERPIIFIWALYVKTELVAKAIVLKKPRGEEKLSKRFTWEGPNSWLCTLAFEHRDTELL